MGIREAIYAKCNVSHEIHVSPCCIRMPGRSGTVRPVVSWSGAAGTEGKVFQSRVSDGRKVLIRRESAVSCFDLSASSLLLCPRPRFSTSPFLFHTQRPTWSNMLNVVHCRKSIMPGCLSYPYLQYRFPSPPHKFSLSTSFIHMTIPHLPIRPSVLHSALSTPWHTQTKLTLSDS
jgi:hypothetical protein